MDYMVPAVPTHSVVGAAPASVESELTLCERASCHFLLVPTKFS